MNDSTNEIPTLDEMMSRLGKASLARQERALIEEILAQCEAQPDNVLVPAVRALIKIIEEKTFPASEKW